MTQLTITQALPWVLSAITIWMNVLAGNKHRSAWLVGLCNQALWLLWIIATSTWGLIPMNFALWIVYARNHWRWRAASEQGLTVAPAKQVTPKDPASCEGRQLLGQARPRFTAAGFDDLHCFGTIIIGLLLAAALHAAIVLGWL